MSHKRARSPSPTVDNPPAAQIGTPSVLSEPIEDRGSTFIALYSPTASAKSLQAHPDFSTASHRMVAWRIPSKQRSLYPGAQPLFDSGHDDDGENYAGKKLEKVLEATNVAGAVVVARWFGGTMLGPVRFTHIETCAREAIAKSKIAENDERAKKRKIDQDEKERAGLVKALTGRDQSIIVLRALLVEKTVGVSSEPAEQATVVQKPTLTKQIDYSIMPLQALKQLDKARDATILWILKKIDEAEEQHKSSTIQSGSGNAAETPQPPGDLHAEQDQTQR